MELAGNLGEMLLPQLIENIYLNKQTGHLRIRHAQQASTLSFQEGELVDAKFGEEAGPEAVYLAMSLPAEAAYEFEPGTVASRRTIDEPWQRVVLKGFCRFKEAKVTKRDHGIKGMPAAASNNLSPPPLDELSSPPSPPRHHLSVKSVAVGSFITAVIVVVVSAAVAIASYSGKLGEGKRSEARPSSGTQSSVVAGAPSSPKMIESILAQSVADASGRNSAAGQAESPGADGTAKTIETAGRTATTAPAGAPADEATPAEHSGGEVTTEDWFVILKTFPKKEQGRAAESGKHFRELGHDARVVETDDFPNFKGGMWAVMLGPYSQEAATEMARRLRTQIPDVYAKPGGTSSRRE